jgi:16S rRNA G966 N2-methylase RsmD
MDTFNLIFIDPPYDVSRNSWRQILNNALNLLSNTNDGSIIFEVPSDLESPVIAGRHELKRLEKTGKRNSPATLVYGRE